MEISKKKILYFDMDGVLVDFDSAVDKLSDDIKNEYKGRYDEIPGIFGTMVPIDGALEAFDKLWNKYDCYILSSACWENPSSYTDKKIWIGKYLGEERLRKRLIFSHQKHLNIGDYLIDDRLKNGAEKFTGEHIHFGSEKFPNWDSVLKYLLDDN